MIEPNQGSSPDFYNEDNIHQYLSDIHGIPRLSAEEEKQLAMQCAAGDEDAIRQMVKSNLRLVVYVARKYAGRGVPLLDLIQEGSIGLLTAAKKYDYTLDLRFSTYATKWIRQGITRYLLNNENLIRVPVHTAERILAIDAARKKLLQERGEEPSIPDIADLTGIPENKISELLALNPDVFSLDIPTGEHSKSTLSETIEDRKSFQPHEVLVRNELEKMLNTMLASLNQRQQQILRMHFGLEDGYVYSLEDIGKQLGISKERARQIERQAMNKLLSMGMDMGLEDFLND